MIERVRTGIPGLDEQIEGGIPRTMVTLVSGSPGAGKTIFGMQFLKYGAEHGERGLYISFEENRKDVLMQAERFGWDFEELEKKDLLHIVNLIALHTNVEKVVSEIEELVIRFKPERLVLDSLSTLGVYTELLADIEAIQIMESKVRDVPSAVPHSGEAVTRRAIMSIIEKVKGLGVTALLTSELQEGSPWLSRDTVSEFICDGVIRLSKIVSIGKRMMTIEKMRSTSHNFLSKNFEIGEHGMLIKE